MLEVEVKIKAPLKETIEKLENLGFVKGTTVYEKDVYYNGTNKDLRAEDKALRIREYRDFSTEKAKFVMNFKGPKIDSLSMTREETEFEIPSFAAGEALFNGLGFFPAGTVEKTRTYYNKNDIECCLDTVTGLGEFLEIEIMAEESDYDSAMNCIKELITSLGLSMNDSIRTSYLCMLTQKK